MGAHYDRWVEEGKNNFNGGAWKDSVRLVSSGLGKLGYNDAI